MFTINRNPSIYHSVSSLIQTEAAKFISSHLKQTLEKRSLFLLLSGGSAVPMYQEMVRRLIEESPDLSRLTVSLFDERFVEKNSLSSNEYQLRQSGIIQHLEEHGATFIPYLSEINRSGQQVALQISQIFSDELNQDKLLCILAGIGDDGHTAGLLTTQDTLTIKSVFESEQFVEYYEISDDIVNHFHQRLTSTPTLIKKANQVIVYSVGDKKKEALQRFLKRKEKVTDCPSLALHLSKNPVIILTDQDVQN